jgi:hypothetical protein
MLFDPPSSPIIVRVAPPESSTSAMDFADVLIRSLGLTAVLVLGAAALGLVVGGFLIGLRIWRARRENSGASYGLRVTPDS